MALIKVLSLCFVVTLANAGGDYQSGTLGDAYSNGGATLGLSGLGLGLSNGLSNGLLKSGLGSALNLGLGLSNGLGRGFEFSRFEAPGRHLAAIQSRRTFEVVPVASSEEPAVPQIIEVEPSEQPVQVIFRTVSSPVNVQQIHTPGAAGQVESTRSEDEPHRVLHEVLRPVIQEVREVIQPYRRVVQEVRPVLEEVHTVVAKGDHSNRFRGASLGYGGESNGYLNGGSTGGLSVGGYSSGFNSGFSSGYKKAAKAAKAAKSARA